MHYHWLQRDAAYQAAFSEAQQMVGDWLEEVAVRRATEGEAPSDVLLIFLLKAAKPAKYRETQRQTDRPAISDLLTAVLLELTDRRQARDVPLEADWAPRPPLSRPARPPRPPPPAMDER
jgi:hypothetical protein